MDNSESTANEYNSVPGPKVTRTHLIGISGCSSSGKTTLATILAHILSRYMDPALQNRKRSPRSIPGAPGVTMLAQDHYFVDKKQCPKIAFNPEPDDWKVIIAKDVELVKVVEGSQPEEYEKVKTLKGDEKFDEMETDVLVLAPNADCTETIDFKAMMGDIRDFKDRKLEEVPSVPAQSTSSSTQGSSLYNNPEIEETRREAEKLVKYLLDKADILFQEFLVRLNEKKEALAKEYEWEYKPTLVYVDPENGKLTCPMGIIEGFLLYPQESKKPSEENEESLHFHLECGTNLFLHMKEKAATERRFKRETYRDKFENEEGQGGQREPGMLWRTKGYWKKAWELYSRYHRFIPEQIEEDKAEPDVYDWFIKIWDNDDSTVEQTVLWALETILRSIEELEVWEMRDWFCREKVTNPKYPKKKIEGEGASEDLV